MIGVLILFVYMVGMLGTLLGWLFRLAGWTSRDGSDVFGTLVLAVFWPLVLPLLPMLLATDWAIHGNKSWIGKWLTPRSR